MSEETDDIDDRFATGCTPPGSFCYGADFTVNGKPVAGADGCHATHDLEHAAIRGAYRINGKTYRSKAMAARAIDERRLSGPPAHGRIGAFSIKAGA